MEPITTHRGYKWQTLARCMLTSVGVVLSLGFVTACRTTVEPEEVSVRPGVNESYRRSDLDVSRSVERFEREGREVYDERAAIVEAIRLSPGMAVADVGAGTGLFTLPFAEAVGPEGNVYAVDIAAAFIEHIQHRAEKQGLRNVQGVLCTERSVELPPNSIDVAFICDTYHHFEYPQSTLASLRRALKPCGEVIIVDFSRVPGESSEWVMNHVRAGQATTEAEMATAGFRKVEEVSLLEENYFVRFRSTRR